MLRLLKKCPPPPRPRLLKTLRKRMQAVPRPYTLEPCWMRASARVETQKSDEIKVADPASKGTTRRCPTRKSSAF